MHIQEIPNNPIANYKRIESFRMLPEDFKVYVSGNTVINHPAPGFAQRTLPTFNHYQEEDGGYVAIYTHSKEDGVYGVGGDIYVVGQVRVQGHYVGRIFVPTGYKLGDNITQDPAILKICEEYFPEMKDQMWVGGDTGGWFGIPAGNRRPNCLAERIPAQAVDNYFDGWW